MPDMQELFFDAPRPSRPAAAAAARRTALLNDPPPSASKVCTLCDLLLPFLSPDDASRGRTGPRLSAQKMATICSETGTAPIPHVLGPGLEPPLVLPWGPGSATGHPRHAVARACLEDAARAGPVLP